MVYRKRAYTYLEKYIIMVEYHMEALKYNQCFKPTQHAQVPAFSFEPQLHA